MQSFLAIFKQFFVKHERHMTSAAFVLGFLWDNLTLTRVDALYDNLVLTAYILIATFGIITFRVFDVARRRGRTASAKAEYLLPLLIQFALGGLFSGYIIYYSRSASLTDSWPFILFLVAMFIGNEVFRNRYHLFTFQLSVLFIAIFSYTIFSVPVLIGKLGTSIFLLSGIISLFFLALVLLILFFVAREQTTVALKSIAVSVGVIYLLFNIAYFTNIIPPIPLSPKEIGVYHSIIRLQDGSYEVLYEPKTRYFFFKGVSKTYHRVENEPIFVYSAVFAPAGLNTEILHRWSYYNELSEEWIVSNEIEFGISGGRTEGYRGYSIKQGVFPGLWRVDVITPRGQLIERVTFDVVSATTPPHLERTYK